MKRRRGHIFNLAQTDANSVAAESYRTIRANIQFSSMGAEVRVLLVTSAREGEGKSTTAANLATVYAQSGRRVLLVDADLRRPVQHKIWSISNLQGVSNVAIRDSVLEDSIIETSISDLFVLPAGQIPPNPSELLSGFMFLQMIHSCRQSYDFIVIDSPPVLYVPDTLALSRTADGVVLVVDAKFSNRRQVQKAISSLEMVNAQLMGTVLNRRKLDLPKNYHEYYSLRA